MSRQPVTTFAQWALLWGATFSGVAFIAAALGVWG